MFRHLMIFALLLGISASATLAFDTLQVNTSDPILEQWRWTTFDRSNGLAGLVRNILEDRDGNIWFATDCGAQRYDGLRWVTYTTKDGLAHNRVNTIAQTSDGAMWFGTEGGISRFDGETWKTYTTVDGLPTKSIWFGDLHQAQDGTLWAGFYSVSGWAGGQGGISRFDGETWTAVEVPDGPSELRIEEIHQGLDGSLWFTTWGKGILRFNGADWAWYTRSDGLAGNEVWGILESCDGLLWFACNIDGISRFDGQRWRTYTTQDGLPEGVGFRSLWQVGDGTIWAGGHNTLCRFDGERWKAYTLEDIPHESRLRVFGRSTRNGVVWVHGFWEDRVFRFDPISTRWRTFITEDSLSGGYPTPDGSVWFGTRNGAVRHGREGKRSGGPSAGGMWLRYTSKDGLLDAPIYLLVQTDDGSLWFLAGEPERFQGLSRYHNGTWRQHSADEVGLDDVRTMLYARDGSFWVIGSLNGASAASQYDGQTWRIYTCEDGLVGESLSHIYQAENGDLWFATTPRRSPTITEGDGLLRFDGKRWTSYTTEDGLSHNRVYGLTQTPDDKIWAGTLIGLSCFDGASWSSYTSGEGLAGGKPGRFKVINNDLWFCYIPPYQSGVTCYDGRTWKTYTTQDGLVSNVVRGIYRATDGVLWFAAAGGVSRFDGTNWTSYTTKDGLPGNDIVRMWQSSNGTFWFLTDDGKAGAFSPDKVEPETVITTTLEDVSSAGNILLKWSGRDLWDDTLPQNLGYQWRLDNGTWSQIVDRTDFTFTSLSFGRHRFEVQAVDRDMNVDPTPAVHAFTVEAPWWRNPWVIGLTVVLAGLVGVQTIRVVQRDRRLREEAEAELRTAHDLQMGLMPAAPPEIGGLEIAGRCIPANHVGGDFFQYFDVDGKLVVTIADVTGHAMDAAIPVMMFSGVLDRQMELGESIQDTFGSLNRILHRTLDSRTFVCFTMGELDPSTHIFRLSNGGCPSPYHFEAATGQITELEVGAYPLGVHPNTEYDVLERQLQPGDRIIFCSDGIIEADNAAGEQFGFEQTAETIRKACKEGLSAEATIDRILEEVAAFKGNTAQSDDMTCVVVRVEDA